MAQDRVVKVTLTAQMQNYLAGMEKARKVTAETASEADKLAKTKQAFDQLGRASLLAGGLLATGLGIAVKRAADFDAAMSNVAATGDDAREHFDALREAAIDAGASTVYSAEESANAIENLAKAGLSASDILGGALAGSLDLAAAGGLDVAEAGEIAATTLQQFGLEGNQATHVADLLAAAAGKAMGDVGDMAQALKQSGLVANQFGISVEETAGSLAAFANAGLLGSDAGTSLRTMLLRLANPTEEVKTLMEELGIEAYDSGGQFIGLQGLAGELEDALYDMTDQQRQATLAMIFGQDAIRAATILYSEGADGIESWTEKVDQAGYAAETAETKLDNLAGDIEALQGAVDSALITMGDAAQGPLRTFTQALTGVVDGFNDMPAGAQQAVFWVGAAGAAAATAAGAFFLGVPKLAAYRAALAEMGPTAQRTHRALGLVAKGVAIGATVVAATTILDQWLASLQATNTELENVARTADTARNALELSSKGLDVKWWGEVAVDADSVRDALESARASAEDWFAAMSQSLGQKGTLDALKQYGDGLASLARVDLPAARDALRQLRDEYNLSDQDMLTFIENSKDLQDAMIQQSAGAVKAGDAHSLLDFALQDSRESTERNEAAPRSLAGQAASTEDDVDGLADTIRNFGRATLDTRDAQRQFEQALDDLEESIKTNGTEFRITEQAGRDNQKAVDDLAEATLDLAASIYEQTGSQEEATKVIETGRQKLIDMVGQFGITGDAAEDYADELGLIPGNVSTYVDLQTQTAMNRLQAFKDALNALPTYKGVSVDTIVGNPSMGGGALPGFSTGGAVHGPGTTGVDSIHIMAAPAENEHTAMDVVAEGAGAERWDMERELVGAR